MEVGDRGGNLDNENNLSQGGCSWVFEGAGVIHSARVEGNAAIMGDGTSIRDRARVRGNAVVSGGATIAGTAEITGNVRIEGKVKIDSGVWNGWAEFVRPLEEAYKKLFDELYTTLRNCAATRSMSDEDVKKMIRNIINLDGRNDAWRQVDEAVLFACEYLRAIFRILRAILPSIYSLLEVFKLGKLLVAGKTLLELENIIEDYADAVEGGGDRDKVLSTLREWYEELHNNICRNESDRRTRLRVLATR